ncbi:hypothetical protein [Sphingomonas sp.]|uniref:hypothetical protein n=1 Tax=Sphingomonas sp. TaxID=28214 RepID=UPI0035C85B2E
MMRRHVTPLELNPVIREIAWGLLGLGFTALVFWGAAWSYPQGYQTIWLVGAATMLAMGVLSAREVWRVRGE